MLGIDGGFWIFVTDYVRYKNDNILKREALEIRLTTNIDKCRVAAHKILNIRAYNNKIFIYYIIKKEYLLWLEFLVMLCLLY